MIVGLGIAAVGVIVILFVKNAPAFATNLEKKLASLPKATSFASFAESSKYYKGGFEPKMTRREAALILGVR